MTEQLHRRAGKPECGEGGQPDRSTVPENERPSIIRFCAGREFTGKIITKVANTLLCIGQ